MNLVEAIRRHDWNVLDLLEQVAVDPLPLEGLDRESRELAVACLSRLPGSEAALLKLSKDRDLQIAVSAARALQEVPIAALRSESRPTVRRYLYRAVRSLADLRSMRESDAEARVAKDMIVICGFTPGGPGTVLPSTM